MARRYGLTSEVYAGYLSDRDVSRLYTKCQEESCIQKKTIPPPPQFYGTRTGMTCKRYLCVVCGPCAIGNAHCGRTCPQGIDQRNLDWITGTTLPDALARSRMALQPWEQ